MLRSRMKRNVRLMSGWLCAPFFKGARAAKAGSLDSKSSPYYPQVSIHLQI
jgi:hypothetical protein